jgi:hypothetical protein
MTVRAALMAKDILLLIDMEPDLSIIKITFFGPEDAETYLRRI